MPEVANSGKDHCDAKPIGCCDDVSVLHRATRLNDCGCAGFYDGFQTIREGKECIGGCDCSLERQHGLHSTEFCGVYTAHLACADADGLAVARVDDGV